MKSIKGPSRYESPLSSKVADGKEGRRACAESLSGLSVAFQATTGSKTSVQLRERAGSCPTTTSLA